MSRNIAEALDVARLASQRAEETSSSAELAQEAADAWSELARVATALSLRWQEKVLDREPVDTVKQDRYEELARSFNRNLHKQLNLLQPHKPYLQPCIGCDKLCPFGNICEECIATIKELREVTTVRLPTMVMVVKRALRDPDEPQQVRDDCVHGVSWGDCAQCAANAREEGR